MSEQTQPPMTNLTCSRCSYVMTARTIAEGFPPRRPDGSLTWTQPPTRCGWSWRVTSGQETKSSVASVPIRRECRSRLEEFCFRFNRRHSCARGLLFYRLLQYAAGAAPPVLDRAVVLRRAMGEGRVGARVRPGRRGQHRRPHRDKVDDDPDDVAPA